MYNKMNLTALCSIFAGIVFRPVEFKPEDLIVGNKFIDLLSFMCKYQGLIFKGIQFSSSSRES